MGKTVGWLWRHGVVSTFLTGLFAILPVVITLTIMMWAGGILREWLGSESILGRGLEGVGHYFGVGNETIASVIGWLLVLAMIWLVGMFVKSFARYKAEEIFHGWLNRIPLISKIYGPVAQVVSMMKKDDNDEMKGMSVVYCEFGSQGGGGFLALLAGKKVFRFGSQDCHVVYIPTSPIPMSGAIVFAPCESVQPVEMEMDDLMQIYFSLGVMSETVIPKQYAVSKDD